MLYDYKSTTPEEVRETVEDALARADAIVEEVVSVTGERTAANTLIPLNEAAAVVAIANGRGPFLGRVHPGPDVRSAGSATEEALAKWGVELLFRRDLYEALEAFATTPEASSLTGEPARLLEHWRRDFRRAGHELPPDGQAQLQEMKERMVELEVAFAKNLDEYRDYLDLTREELEGLPDDFVSRLRTGQATGTFRVSLDYPELHPFLQQARRRDLREKMSFKAGTKAASLNRPLIEEAVATRLDMARLLGRPSWSHHRMEVKMARSPEQVADFYDGLLPDLTKKARNELEKMASLLQEDHPGAELQPWDVAYYHNHIKEAEFGVDQSEVAGYFPLDAVLGGLLDLTAEVFGLQFEELDAPTWHPDVSVYQITDAGKTLAHFYLDLFPRDGKFGHAAAFDLVSGYQPANGDPYVRPIAAMVANFTPPTASTPSLLRHSEVVTLFHEFGHVLHQCLTKAAMVRFSGASTEWDFVEAPSQIMEHWSWDARILQRFSRHHETGDPIPTALVDNLVATRDLNIGIHTLRQVFFGLIDLMLHDESESRDLEALSREAYEVMQLPYHEGTFFLAGFGHLMGGYDAGYYGYLWSRVFGDDMYSRFESEGVLNPEVGRAYRSAILERGGTRDAEDLLVDFLGRPPSNEAFLRNLGL